MLSYVTGIEMNKFKDEFSTYTSEYLLKLRARGSDLSDEAHEAIEMIFMERREQIPARPQAPIDIDKQEKIGRANSSLLKAVGLILVGLVGIVAAKAFAHTIAGFFVGVAIGLYYLMKWLSRANLSSQEEEKLVADEKVKEDGLTELMVACANGDMRRAIDLLSYGVDVNARSRNGSTALMYAARNNQIELVKTLLSHGASIDVKNHNGSTASSLANTYGHHDVAELFKK